MKEIFEYARGYAEICKDTKKKNLSFPGLEFYFAEYITKRKGPSAILVGPVIVLDGRTTKNSRYILESVRNESDNDQSRNLHDISTGNEGSYLVRLKKGSLEGNYLGIIMNSTSREEGIFGNIPKMLKLAQSAARQKHISDVLLRGTSNRVINPEYSIDIFSKENLDEEEERLSGLAAKLDIETGFARINGLKRH